MVAWRQEAAQRGRLLVGGRENLRRNRGIRQQSEPLPFPQAHLKASAILAAVLGLVAFVMYVLVPQSALNNDLLPLQARAGLFALELLATLGFAFLASIPLAIWLSSERAESGRARAAALVALGVFYGLLSFAYMTSWAVFRSTGRFLDGVTLRLWSANRVQIFQHTAHMEAGTLLFVPVVAALILAGILLGPRLRALRREGAPRAASTAYIAVGIVAVVTGLVGSRYTSPGIFNVEARERTGPILHAGWDIYHRLTTGHDPIHRTEPPEVVRRPIVPMDEYLAAAEAGGIERHNVIVLLVESLRTDQLLAYGGRREVMPNVERVAREGRVFLDHYTQASHSDYADLAPLASQYPLRSPTYHIYPPDPPYPRVLIHDVLKALGYRTGIFSSQNENWSGMIHFLDTGNWDRILHAATYDGPTYVPRAEYQDFYRFLRGQRRAGKIDDRFTVAEAISWIGEEADRPFFIYMNLQSSHVPYEVPADFPRRFASGQVSFPIRLGYFPPDSVEAVKDLYADALAYVDFHIGRLLEFLEERELLERTILVISGDTGQAFWEHGFVGHASALYNEVLKVPLVVRGPGVEPGTDERLSEHVDVPPSVFHLLGLPPHPSFQGMDLFAAEDDGSSREAFLVVQAAAHQYAIVTEGHKLIYDTNENRYLLFDLVEDPGEHRDLSEGRGELVERLAARLHAWRKAQLDYYADADAQRRWYPPTLTRP